MKGTTVVYIDPAGAEHDALVTAINPLHENVIDIAYVDMGAVEAENLKKVFAVVHASDPSKDEVREHPVSDAALASVGQVEIDGNPELPRYVINAWKYKVEEHKALPVDHPQFDHPFKQPDLAQNGEVIPVERPGFDADKAGHLAQMGSPSAEDLDAVASEQKVAAQTEPDVATQLDQAKQADSDSGPETTID